MVARIPLFPALILAALIASACVAPAERTASDVPAAADDDAAPAAVAATPDASSETGDTTEKDAQSAADKDGDETVSAAPVGAYGDKLYGDDDAAAAAVADATPPHLVILSPQPDSRLDDSYVLVKGLSEPGATVTAGDLHVEVDPDGQWRAGLILSEGSNVATFTAKDAEGNSFSQSLVLHYEKPVVVASAPKVQASGQFSASQLYGFCSEDPPYDVFSGTAAAGATIHVKSAYGQGSVVADAGGHWEVKVFFPDAPANEVFDVKVTDGVHFQHFEFYHEV